MAYQPLRATYCQSHCWVLAIAWLMFELTFYDVAINRIRHYAMSTLSGCLGDRKLQRFITKTTRFILFEFFEAVNVSVLLYGCTTWIQTKYLEKKLDENYVMMLRTVLNKSWKQTPHPQKQLLCRHLPPTPDTIHVRWIKNAGNYNWSKDELTINISQLTPYTWTYQCLYTCKSLHPSLLCGH